MKQYFQQLLKVFNQTNMMKENNNLCRYIKLDVPKTPGQGEDAEPILIESSSSNRFFIAVADGMGGSGSTNYEYKSDMKTGAYIASRTIIEACRIFFTDCFKSGKALENIYSDLKEYLREQLKQRLKDSKSEPSALKSKLIRVLPTTLAGIHIEKEGNKSKVTSIWAGDSRAYILTANKGLEQITVDDLKESLDPYENLHKDSQLKNFISADTDFILNHREFEFEEPLLAIVATDGCFGYFNTPMQFEYMVLDSLHEAETDKDWTELLSSKIKSVVGDDFSMLILMVGWDNDFSRLKEDFIQRKNELYGRIEVLEFQDMRYLQLITDKERLEEQIRDIHTARQDSQKRIWEEYKKTYYKIQNDF